MPHYPDMEYPPTFEAGSYTIPGTLESSRSPVSRSLNTTANSPHHNLSSSLSHHSNNSFSSHSNSRVETQQPTTSQPYAPPYIPRTPKSPTLYYNLQGFNSASMPSLPCQDQEGSNSCRSQRSHRSSGKLQQNADCNSTQPCSLPITQRPQMPLPSSSVASTTALSLHIPAQSSSLTSPQASPKPSTSPRVIVGISCSGSDCVVSHHHSIYVTSPVKPNITPRPRLDPPISSNSISHNQRDPTEWDSLACKNRSSPHSSSSDDIQKASRRRTPPGSFVTSQSNSSLESIHEHGHEHGGVMRSGSGAYLMSSLSGASNSRSGGSTTVLDPLTANVLPSNSHNSDESFSVGKYQFGGSSGGTVISTPVVTSHKTVDCNARADSQVTSPTGRPGRPKLDPPRLVLPGPPSDPPPDD